MRSLSNRCGRVTMSAIAVGICAVLLLGVSTAVAGAAAAQSTGLVELVSVDTEGLQLGSNSRLPTASAATSRHGRFVVFQTTDSTLVDSDTNGIDDVFLRDRSADATSLVSGFGGVARGGSGASISADGRYVAFLSASPLLSDDDDNGENFDVFVRDMQTDQIVLASQGSDGTQRNVDSQSAVISGDGHSVAFLTAARLSPRDDDRADVEEWRRLDVYVHDLDNGHTRLISVNQDGNNFNGPVGLGGINYSGDLIGFNRAVSGTDAGFYLRNLARPGSSIIWREDLPLAGGWIEGAPAVSGNGRYAAFASKSPRLDQDPDFPVYDIARYDRRSGKISLVSVGIEGGDAHGDSWAPTLSHDGMQIGFASEAGNLVHHDDNDATDAFLYDFDTRVMTLASGGPEGPGNFSSSIGGGVGVSASGANLVFHSYADNLVVNDTNQRGDVFIWTATP